MLLLVSNRLPITVTEKDGALRFKESVGGLATGLSAYLEKFKEENPDQNGYHWLGWPGISVKDALKHQLQKELDSLGVPILEALTWTGD